MFRITAETCRSFTFGEILILAAINVETIRLGFDCSVPRKTTRMQRGYISASQSVRTTVSKALQA